MARMIIDLGFKDEPPKPISFLARFWALIVSFLLVVFLVTRLIFVELSLLQRFYGRFYTAMRRPTRWSFVMDHICAVTQLVIFVLTVYPVIRTVLLGSPLRAPYAFGSIPTTGDVLVVAMQILMGMTIFQLLNLTRLPVRTLLRYSRTVIIGIWASQICLRLNKEPAREIQFLLCAVWGTFDLVSGISSHTVSIVFSAIPIRPKVRCAVPLAACISITMAVLTATALIIVLLVRDGGRLVAQVALVHVVGSIPQAHTAYSLWKLYQYESECERLLREAERMRVEHARWLQGVYAAHFARYR